MRWSIFISNSLEIRLNTYQNISGMRLPFYHTWNCAETSKEFLTRPKNALARVHGFSRDSCMYRVVPWELDHFYTEVLRIASFISGRVELDELFSLLKNQFSTIRPDGDMATISFTLLKAVLAWAEQYDRIFSSKDALHWIPNMYSCSSWARASARVPFSMGLWSVEKWVSGSRDQMN